MLKTNDIAPTNIKILNENGEETTLKHYLKKPLLVYFYPKDNTPGCTLEAQQFRDFKKEIETAGAAMVGISKDSPESHRKFKQKHDLNFELLSDPDHQLQEAFGVWQEKRMMGKSFMGTVRSSFLIDTEGKIIKVWPRVKPKEHAQEVLETVRQLLN